MLHFKSHLLFPQILVLLILTCDQIGPQPFLPLSAPAELVIPPAPTPVTTEVPTDVDVKPPGAPEA